MHFGEYDVAYKVAVGSTGTVYQARHREIDRIAAIKELSAELRAVPGLLERFRAEARTLACLDDEHVVAVYDFVEEPGRVWIAEEWVDGLTIAALQAAHGPLSAEQCLGVLRGALLGLAHAHDRGVVHRDFSPSNIIADRAGTSKLVDFGLAAPVGDSGICGTPAYMSPESARGEAVGKPGDVYSAAAVLFGMLAGRLPFPAPTPDLVLQAHLNQPPPPLSGHGPAMARLIARSMAKDPAVRPADARAFLQGLEEAAAERYGAAWLQRASIAGLVAGATGGIAAVETTGVVAGVAVEAARPIQFIDATATTGSASVPAAATRGGSRVNRRWVVGGSAAAAVTIGILVAALASNGSDAHRAAPPASNLAADRGPGSTVSSPSPSRSAAPTLSALVPNGRYRYLTLATSTTFPDSRVGRRVSGVWTIRLRCGSRSCTGTVVSSSGATYQAAFDGTTLTLTTKTTTILPCHYASGPKKGQISPGSKATGTVSYSYRARAASRASGPSPAAGVPLSFTGSGSVYAAPQKLIQGPCDVQKQPERESRSLTLTRVS